MTALLNRHRENVSMPDEDDTVLSTPLSSPASECIESYEASSDVESLVYYFSVEIRPLRASLKNYSFFLDPLRSKMILKWMKFYSFSPQLTGDIHKQRRNELKKHLKLRPQEFSQQLGSFMIDKFWSLKHRGWISGDIHKPPVKYHECTDHWLDHSWDGLIDLSTRETAMEKSSLKRSAPTIVSFRQKSLRHYAGKALSEVNSTNRKTRQQNAKRDLSKAPFPKIYDLVTPNESIDDNESRCTASCNQSNDASPVPPIQASSQTLESVSRVTNFDASELSMRLETISKDKTTSGDQTLTSISKVNTVEPYHMNNSIRQGCVILPPTTKDSSTESPLVHNPVEGDLSITSTPRQTLEALRKSARACKRACNDIVANIKELKPIRDQLVTEYDRLYDEIKTFHIDIMEAKKRVPPTPANGMTASTAASCKQSPEIFQKLDNPHWLESRKAAKALLSQEITKMEKKYNDLQAQYSAKATDLRALRSTIKERKELIKRYNTEVGCLLEDFGKNSDWVDPDSQLISDTDVESDEED